MLFTHRGVVDDEGIIRLLDQIELKEGTHVLVTVADPDTLIALFRPGYPSKMPEERLREELEEECSVGLSVERSAIVTARFPFSDLSDSTIRLANGAPNMLHTYRGKVNEDGTIRLWEQIDLPAGREVLVTVLEKHQLLPLMGPAGEIRYDEERQRIEEAEDEYWAQALKDLPSL